jgi:hypothetical protein
MLDDGFWRSGAQGNVYEHGRGGRSTSKSARLVHEDANPLVARPRETETIGFGADSPGHLGDRNRLVVEANQRL